ncbi:MAG: sodium:proton antiporter [Elusimicrobia bacterium]|nr:sodium:proton antiporter [Elusimicrobiota bacterium]
MIEYFLCLILFSVGLYAVFVKRNLLKIIIGIAIMGYAVNLLFILIGYKINGEVPIIEQAGQNFVDPLAQAFVLITVIIGLSVTVLLVSLAMRLYEKYGTLDVDEMKKLKG